MELLCLLSHLLMPPFPAPPVSWQTNIHFPLAPSRTSKRSSASPVHLYLFPHLPDTHTVPRAVWVLRLLASRTKDVSTFSKRHTTAHAKIVILMKTIGTSQLWDPSSGRAAKFAWNRPINTEVIKKCWMSGAGEIRKSVSAKIFLWKSGNQKNKEVFQ